MSAAAALALPLAGCGEPEKEATVPAEQTPAPTPPGSPTDPTAPPPTDATGSAPAGRSEPPLSPTRLPTMGRPAAPPSFPTDQRRVDVLAGRITRGGAGPCYGLVTDDGREYALHGTGKGTFATGTWVRVTVGPADPGVDCGPGTPATIMKISPVG